MYYLEEESGLHWEAMAVMVELKVRKYSAVLTCFYFLCNYCHSYSLSLILRWCEVVPTYLLFSLSDAICFGASFWHHQTIEYFQQSEWLLVIFFSTRNFKNGTECTLIGGNIKWSDDIKNKPSNKDI